MSENRLEKYAQRAVFWDDQFQSSIDRFADRWYVGEKSRMQRTLDIPVAFAHFVGTAALAVPAGATSLLFAHEALRELDVSRAQSDAEDPLMMRLHLTDGETVSANELAKLVVAGELNIA